MGWGSGAWGAMPWGDGGAGDPVFSFPQVVDNEGGMLVQTTRAGLPNGTYNVYLGPLGTTEDPICYSGVAGQGNVVIVRRNLERFTVPVPPLPTGGPYAFTLVNTVTGDTYNLEPSITVVRRQFRSLRYTVRRRLPRDFEMGPRRTDFEEYPQL